MTATKGIAVGLLVMFVIVISACAGGSSNSSDTPSATFQSAPVDPVDEYLSTHSQRAEVACQAFFTLVDQGWTTDEIIGELDNAGTFDSWPGGQEAAHKLVKWCYANG